MLVVMVGLPGSGKTTWAKANFRHVVSPDAIRKEEFGTRFDPKLEPQVWRRAYRVTAELLARRDVVCFDATSVTRRRRRRLIALAAEARLPAIAVWVQVPEPLAWERNVAREGAVPRAAFRRLARAFQPPALEEGFAAVIRVSGGTT